MKQIATITKLDKFKDYLPFVHPASQAIGYLVQLTVIPADFEQPRVIESFNKELADNGDIEP